MGRYLHVLLPTHVSGIARRVAGPDRGRAGGRRGKEDGEDSGHGERSERHFVALQKLFCI